MDNNSERKRLCRIERKRKKAALRVTLLKRILVTAVCAAIITGMGRDLIPAMAEETTAAPTGSVPAVSAPGSTDTGNNSGAVGSTGSGSSDSSDSAVTSGTGGTGSTGSTDTGTGTDTDKTETTATAATDENPLLLNAMLLGAGNPNSETGDSVAVESYSLYKQADPPVQITSGTTTSVTSTTKFEVDYKLKKMFFDSTRVSGTDSTYIVSGHSYTLPALPEGLEPSSEYQDYVISTSGEGSHEIAKITVSKDNSGRWIPTLTITDSNTDDEFLDGIYLKIGSQFTETVKTQENVTLSFDNGTSYSFNLTDNTKIKPSLVKSGKIDPDDHDYILWEVDMKNDPSNPVTLPEKIVLSDSLDSRTEYVTGTFKVNGVLGSEPTQSGNDLSYTYTLGSGDNAAGKVIKFTYDTKFKSGTTLTDGSLTVKNKARIKDESGTDITDEATGTCTVSSEPPSKCYKELSGSVSSDGYCCWKVTVTNGAAAQSDVVLFDAISSDTDYPMTLVTGDNVHPFKVGDSGYDSSKLTTTAGEDTAGKAFTWKYDLGAMQPNESKVITYYTHIKNYAGLIKSTHAAPENEAWLNYTQDIAGTGSGTYSYRGNGPVGLNKTTYVITKECTGYDPQTNEFTWKITVNQNKNVFTEDLVVVDTLPADGSGTPMQKYVSDTAGNVCTGISGASVDKETDGPKELKYTFKNVFNNGTTPRSGAFEIVTKLTDAEIAKYNSDKTYDVAYKNKAALYEGTSNEPLGDDTAEKSIGKSDIIDKSVVSTDQDKHKITWKLVIDQQNMPMKDIHMSDTLPTGLSLDTGSVTYQSAGADARQVSTASGSDYTDHVVIDGQKLDFYSADITKQLTVQFTTSYDPDKIAGLADIGNNDKSVKIANTATLYNISSTGGIISGEADAYIMNHRLHKELYTKNEPYLTYHVEINGAGRSIASGYTIRDVMPKGLKVTSMQLKAASVNADGSFNISSLRTVSPEVYSLSSGQNTNGETSITLKFRKAIDSPYMLVYTVNASGRTSDTVSNTVYEGTSAGSGLSQEVTSNLSEWGEAGGNSGSYYYVKVVKRDAADGNTVTSGDTVFGLTDGNGNVLDQETTQDGYVYFSFPDASSAYKLTELQAPQGYYNSYSGKYQAVVMPANKGKNNAAVMYFDDARITVPPTPAPHNPSTPSSSESSSTTSVSTTTGSKTTSKTTSVTSSSATSTTTSKPPEYFDIHHNPVNPDTFKGEVLGADGRKVRGARRGYDVLGNRRAGTSTGDDSPVWPIAVLIISAAGMVLINRFRHYLRNKR